MALALEYNLDDEEIQKAILFYVKDKTGIDVKKVRLSFFKADPRDPRERDAVSAKVTQ